MIQDLLKTVYDCAPIPFQNVACSAMGLWHRSERYRRFFDEVLEELLATQWASRAELEAIQRDRLAEVLEVASTSVPYYRSLDRQRSSALHRWPVLDKGTVQRHGHRLRSDRFPRLAVRRIRTSGTTGSPLRLLAERRAIVEEFATVWRLRCNMGVKPGCRNLTFTGRSVVPIGQTGPPYWRFNRAENQILFSQYHASPENLPHYVDVIRRQDRYYLQGYPSFIHLIAVYLLEHDIEVPPPLAVFTSSESLLAWQRERIERAFRAPVRDRCGAVEFCVSMIECEEGRLHVDEEFCIVELEGVIDETPSTESGRLLCTGLANRAMPLIRYRIGDVGTRCRYSCECGRASTTFASIDGRVEDYVITPEGVRVGRMDHVFKKLRHIRETQILQDDVAAIDVKVVREERYAKADERHLIEALRARLGERIEIRVHYVREIPRTDRGKFRAVLSNVIDSRDPLAPVVSV